MRLPYLPLAIILLLPSLCFGQQSFETIRIDHRGRKYYGRPVAWDGNQMMLLRRDGRTSLLPVRSHNDYQRISPSFKPFSSNLLRSRLQQEFGDKYQVSATSNFLVVHPPGDYQRWAVPFQVIFNRFKIYFQMRGLKVSEPEFPLVAVVVRTRGEFDRFLTTYHDYHRDLVGYYSVRSNRIITYDQSEGRGGKQATLANNDTIIHEAVHQAAFNSGIHNRFGTIPRWVSEGLATMFEARGVNNPSRYTRQSDRINRGRLNSLLRHYESGTAQGKLAGLIRSDHLFDQNPDLAYALSWGLTFYLAETRPTLYYKYLNLDRKRPNYAPYSPQDRLKLFTIVFGNNLDVMDAEMQRFIKSLR